MRTNQMNQKNTKVIVEGTINAPVDDVFPLACPVMEYKWIPGWKCELVDCPNGHAELGIIFNERTSAPILTGTISQKSRWTAVLYDVENHKVHYQVENKVSSSLYKLEFKPDGAGRTRYYLEWRYTPIAERGVKLMNSDGQAKIRFMVSALARMLKHYCENGELIDRAEILKMAMQVDEMTMLDRVRSLSNNLLAKFRKDENRIRFMQGLPISKVQAE